jgi:hypothetical protein
MARRKDKEWTSDTFWASATEGREGKGYLLEEKLDLRHVG